MPGTTQADFHRTRIAMLECQSHRAGGSVDQACPGAPDRTELRDLRAQLQAERDARRLSEQALESLAGRAASGVVSGRLIRDLLGRPTDLVVTQANSIALGALGVQRQTILGRALGELASQPGSALARFVLSQCLDAGAMREQFSPDDRRWYAVAPGLPQPEAMAVLILDVTAQHAGDAASWPPPDAAGQPPARRHTDGEAAAFVRLMFGGPDRALPVALGAACAVDSADVRAEEELAQVQAHADLLAGGLQDTFAFRWLQGERRLDYVSASVEAVTGYGAGEVAADLSLLTERVHPEDRLALGAALRATELMRRPVQFRWFRRDGRVIWLEQRLVPVGADDGGAPTLHGLITDISGRVAAQEAISEAKRKQQELLSLMPMVTYRIDLRGRRPRFWVSDNVSQVTGYSATELDANPFLVLSRIHPDDIAEVRRRLGAVRNGGWLEVDYRWQHADGTYHRYFQRAEVLGEDGATREVRGAFLRLSDVGNPPAATLAVDGAPQSGGASGWCKVRLQMPAAMAGRPRRPGRCPHCGADALSRHQSQRRLLDDGQLEVEVVRYRCEGCGRTFTEHPGGVSQSSQTEAVRRVSALLYGLGLSLRQVTHVLDRAGVHLSPSSIRRNAQGAGTAIRRSLPSGVRCVLAEDDAPSAGAFVVLSRVSFAGHGTKPTMVELLVWSDDDELLAWLRQQAALLGMDVLA